jgi:hypothetical protein
LFADIGTEANGTTLSVLSVFARLGTDPWTEANRLATLSKRDATDHLAHLIASMPTSLWALPEAVVIAVRLIGLLPARPAIRVVGRPTAIIGQAARKWPLDRIALIAASVGLVVAFAILMTR